MPRCACCYGGYGDCFRYECQWKTTVDSASATTDAAQGGGDLTFTIAVTNIGAKGADINITPSNDSDTYYFDVYPASVVDQIPDDNQLIAAIISANDGDVTKFCRRVLLAILRS